MNPNLTAEGTARTEQAERRLRQLCRHAAKMRDSRSHVIPFHAGGHMPPEMQGVECTETQAIITVEGGRCVVEARRDSLTLRAEAADGQSLQRIQELVARRLEAIGSRERLKVIWQAPGS